jgi:hypothetical protein
LAFALRQATPLYLERDPNTDTFEPSRDVDSDDDSQDAVLPQLSSDGVVAQAAASVGLPAGGTQSCLHNWMNLHEFDEIGGVFGGTRERN